MKSNITPFMGAQNEIVNWNLSSCLPTADLSRVLANIKLDPKRKSALGQFFTPEPICRFMASLFHKIEKDVSLLDPGCGVGSLLAAFTDEALSRGEVDSLQITAYDIEEKIKPYLLQTFENCLLRVEKYNITIDTEFIEKDFITTTSNGLSSSLFKTGKTDFTHVIMNPPYKKILSSGVHRKALSTAGIETVNLYSAFVALAIKLLKPGGEIVAIIPRSFCNGPYYLPFRELLLSQTSIEQIHIFESRSDSFSEDKVLQENIIIHCIKGADQGKIKITSSSSSDFKKEPESGEILASDMTVRVASIDEIVKPKDRQRFFHIAPDKSGQAIINHLACFDNKLEEIGLEVSTGPVVDFRLKDDLRKDLEEGSVPLLYPVHCAGTVQWPKDSKKPNAIHVSKESKPWLWRHQGNFVIVRRFSSKEEKRRIVASVYNSELSGDLVGFDNKLNVFHSGKVGFEDNVSKGLYIFLNSTILDSYYRQFGGHTQVNATDLRMIKYPSLESLRRMGKQVFTQPLPQDKIDSILDGEISLMKTNDSGNPLNSQEKIDQAFEILKALGMPKAQQNDRSALTLLALCNLHPDGSWDTLERPMLGVTPIMDWVRDVYGREYAPNSRETFRRQTLHQFVDGGMVLYNPDKPGRPVNSPKACYQVTPELFELLKTFSSAEWEEKLKQYLKTGKTLAQKYAKARKLKLIPLQVAEGEEIKLSPGAHSKLIRDIVSDFGPRFVPGSEVIYVGDTGDKIGYFREDRLKELGVEVDNHGKMPDVVLYYPPKDWLLLIESVTSHGPVDGKRHGELSTLFKQATPGLVYVTAFNNRRTMAKYLSDISWETEVWVADAPTHMIHFNGDKFLGPNTTGN